MAKSFNLSAWAIRHGSLVGFFLVTICVAGLQSYLSLGRSEDPNYTIKAANVLTQWPGASAEEMRDQIADPVVKILQTVPYFDRIESYATPGFLEMQVWVKDFTPPDKVPDSFYQMRKKLRDLAPALPRGVEGPMVDDEFGDVDSILLSIEGDGARYSDLNAVAEKLRLQLLQTSAISKVRLYGKQNRRIFVEYQDSKLANLGASPEAILAALADHNAILDPGTLDSGQNRLRISMVHDIDDLQAVRDTPMTVGDRVLRIGDVATVTSGYEDPPTFLVRHNGRESLVLGVVMAQGGNLTELDGIVDEALAGVSLPVGVDVQKIADQPRIVSQAIWEFMRAFGEALTIVLAVCLVVLGWRIGLIVAMAVPIVLAITFIVMRSMGIDLHRVSLGALIISLGLLVDDAIIAIESMLTRMQSGLSPKEAAAAAWNSTAFPMLTGTLVTAIGFMPVGFAPSSTGEYMRSMFFVIAIATLSSWAVAVIFTPWLGVKLLSSGRGAHEKKGRMSGVGKAVSARIRALVTWSADHYGAVIFGVALLFGASIFGFVVVHKQFFPISERTELFVQLRLPQGSSIVSSSKAAETVEGFLKGDPDATSISTYVGQGPPRFWLALNPALPNTAYAELVVLGRDLPARERLKAKLEGAFASGLVAGARTRVDRFSFGPPVGFPVQFRLSGPDTGRLRDIGENIRAVMAKDSRLVDPHANWNELAPTLRLNIDPYRTQLLGLSAQNIARRVKMAVDGVTATVARDSTETVSVVLRSAEAWRRDPGSLEDSVVATSNGTAIPLSQVARIDTAFEEPIIWLRDRQMTLTVRADVRDGVQAPDVSADIWAKLDAIRAGLPLGYRLEEGGAYEESMKANLSIAKIFPGVFLLMLMVIMFQVQSPSRLALVLLSAPLGLIGASFALNVSGAPFGFVALLGLLALSGMDIRNSVILIDQVEANLRMGMAHRRAIIEATVARSRPVALTAAAAVLALIPLSRSLFWGPMALTIMGGLSLATFMTVMFLPALYSFWFRKLISSARDLADPRAMAPAAVGAEFMTNG